LDWHRFLSLLIKTSRNRTSLETWKSSWLWPLPWWQFGHQAWWSHAPLYHWSRPRWKNALANATIYIQATGTGQIRLKVLVKTPVIVQENLNRSKVIRYDLPKQQGNPAAILQQYCGYPAVILDLASEITAILPQYRYRTSCITTLPQHWNHIGSRMRENCIIPSCNTVFFWNVFNKHWNYYIHHIYAFYGCYWNSIAAILRQNWIQDT